MLFCFMTPWGALARAPVFDHEGCNMHKIKTMFCRMQKRRKVVAKNDDYQQMQCRLRPSEIRAGFSAYPAFTPAKAKSRGTSAR